MTALEVGRLTPADYALILDEMPAFWGERDLRYAHHPFLVHELADSSVALRSGSTLVGYLFGFVVPDTRVAYVHLVAVREGFRRGGLAKRLYAEFEAIAHERGATSLKAITTPGNDLSIGFHRALGMSVERVDDYAGPGHDRVVFTRSIAGAAPLLGLDHAQVAVPPERLDAARAFYGEVLGLRAIERPDSLGGTGAWFAAGRQQLHVGVDEGEPPARKAHPAFEVTPAELDRLAAALPAAGFPADWDTRLTDRRRLYTSDPAGNRIELLAR